MMDQPTAAYGLVTPEGELTAFAGHEPDFAWVVFAGMFDLPQAVVKTQLTKDGWRVVPVAISQAEGRSDA